MHIYLKLFTGAIILSAGYLGSFFTGILNSILFISTLGIPNLLFIISTIVYLCIQVKTSFTLVVAFLIITISLSTFSSVIIIDALLGELEESGSPIYFHLGYSIVVALFGLLYFIIFRVMFFDFRFDAGVVLVIGGSSFFIGITSLTIPEVDYLFHPQGIWHLLIGAYFLFCFSISKKHPH